MTKKSREEIYPETLWVHITSNGTGDDWRQERAEPNEWVRPPPKAGTFSKKKNGKTKPITPIPKNNGIRRFMPEDALYRLS